MMNYRQYEAEDFVADASFQAWVQYGSDDDFWRGWQAANPDRVAVVEAAKELVEALRFHSTEVDPAEMEAVMQNITRTLDPVKKNSTSALRRLLYAASAVAAAIIISLVFLWPQPATVTITTAFGETRDVLLPDGSLVTLNANSSLEYRKSWHEKQEREVTLTGEAFFKVTSRPNGFHPKFKVHTPLADVQVLGTAFNMRNRRNEVTVVLEEGKVQINDMEMAPGDLVTVSGKGSARRKVEPARFSAWKEHRLVFDNETLAGITQVLEDTYGYHVTFRKTGAQSLRLTGSYPTDRLNLLFAAIREVHRVKVQQQGAAIIIE